MSWFTEIGKHSFHLVFLVEVNHSSVPCLGILSWQPSILNDRYLNNSEACSSDNTLQKQALAPLFLESCSQNGLERMAMRSSASLVCLIWTSQ